jgi:hypothetical protein
LPSSRYLRHMDAMNAEVGGKEAIRAALDVVIARRERAQIGSAIEHLARWSEEDRPACLDVGFVVAMLRQRTERA